MIKQSILVLLLFGSQAYASDLNSAYQEGTQVGAQNAQKPIDILSALDLKQIPGFEQNLPQEHYYSGVTQQQTGLEADADKAINTNDAGTSINNGFNDRPFFQINPNSESMQKLNQIADDADEIMHGRSSNQVTCALKPSECQYSWEKKTCSSGKSVGSQHCLKTLNVNLSTYKSEKYNLYVHSLTPRIFPWQVSIDLAQTNTCLPFVSPCYKITKDSVVVPAIQIPSDCAFVKVNLIDNAGLVSIVQNPTCANPNFTLNIGICQNGHCWVPYYYSVVITVEIYQLKEEWDNTCSHLEHQVEKGLCFVTEPFTCIEANQTHVINGIPITRSCWKERKSFSCGKSGQNTCENLIKQGCEQTESFCIEDATGSCKAYQQTYQCPTNQCTDNQLICGEDAFCLEGDCASHEYRPSNEEDFKEAMAALSGASEASKDLDVKGNFVFKGQLLECSNLILGAGNCCRDSGWGIDLNLVHCSDSEKQLGTARENKLVVSTGEYCYKRQDLPVGSVCIEHHETFCVFQSKLARLIQEQGRRDQLHIGFGEGQYSNCSGLTPEQLQLINFKSINFAEFYKDIENRQNKPDVGKTTSGISERLKQFYDQGGING